MGLQKYSFKSGADYSCLSLLKIEKKGGEDRNALFQKVIRP